jgi:hypothetical protein
MTGWIAYTAVFIFTFFAGSFLIARFAHESPTEPSNFMMLVGASLAWPLTLPLAGAIFFLFVIARMADALAEKMKG